MQRVGPKRDVSALVRVLEGPQASTSELHRALIAVCTGPASVIAEGVPASEELEAGLLLLRTYAPRTKQSKVIRFISILNVDLNGGCLLDKMHEVEGLVAECERETAKKLEDDVKLSFLSFLHPG